MTTALKTCAKEGKLIHKAIQSMRFESLPSPPEDDIQRLRKIHQPIQ